MAEISRLRIGGILSNELVGPQELVVFSFQGLVVFPAQGLVALFHTSFFMHLTHGLGCCWFLIKCQLCEDAGREKAGKKVLPLCRAPTVVFYLGCRLRKYRGLAIVESSP